MQLSWPGKLYVLCVALLGVALAAGLAVYGEVGTRAALFGFVFVLIIASFDIFATYIPELQRRISPSVAVAMAGLLILGPEMGVVAGTLGTLLSELFLRWDRIRQTGSLAYLTVVGFNTGQIGISLSAAALALAALGFSTGELRSVADTGKAVLGFVSLVTVNSSLVTVVIALETKERFRYLTEEWIRTFAVQHAVLGIAALLLVALYSITPWHMLLGLAPLVLVHLSFRGYLRLREEAQKTFEKVVQLLEQRDPYTGEHSDEVAELATEVAEELDMRSGELDMLRAVARVHDIGKIAIPDRILLKPGKLDPDEWETMKRHAEIGADLLKGLAIYDKYANVVLHEHEHWNGGGYPNGLRGEQIPAASRIIAAADVYHALISDRPYRPAYMLDDALDILRKMSGRELDPKVVGALLRVLERRGEEAQRAEAAEQ